MEKTKKRAFTCGIKTRKKHTQEAKKSLLELENLAKTCEMQVIGSSLITVSSYHPSTFFSSGKIEQIQKDIEDSKAELFIADARISATQVKNLEKELKVPVMDRSQLILNIFSQRAKTYEGKLQAELAYYLNELPHMVGLWKGSLSRLGGGIGTKGPGEKALEKDRRNILNKISKIKRKLEQVQKVHETKRKVRKKSNAPHFALIGYTNSGKSTLFKALTKKNTFIEDKLFATLDSMTRKIFLKDSGSALLTDTVGFISDLPQKWLQAFRTTLEDSKDSHILIHVVDASSPHHLKEMETVEEIINLLGWKNKSIIKVFNKIDETERKFPRVFESSKTVYLSALKKQGLDLLKKVMQETLDEIKKETDLFFSEECSYLLGKLDQEAKVYKIEKGQYGVSCKALLSPLQIKNWSSYVVKKTNFKKA